MKSSAKYSSTSNNSKSKKNVKDREKRKSQSYVEQQNSEKGSPNKESSCRKYAGIGADQLTNIADQSVFEHLTEEVCVSFAEDVNYKLRQIIFDSRETARLSNRNHISSSDIDYIFECLQIDKVYGATSSPHWIPFGDQTYFYLEDQKINLVEIAEEALSYSQPMEPVLTKKWSPESKEVNKHLKLYFIMMCQAVIEKDSELRLTALGNICENKLIGPIVEWFYHFGYILLSKDITYDNFTLYAFDLLRALESNPIAVSTVSEKQIFLLNKLLLHRLLSPSTKPEILKPICGLLAMLCRRTSLRKIVLKKIVAKLAEAKHEYALPIMCAVNELGLDAIFVIFTPHMDYFFSLLDNQTQPDFTLEILRCYNILCAHQNNIVPICNAFFEVFTYGIVPFWKNFNIPQPVTETIKMESNWLHIKVRLLKSRQRITPIAKERRKIHIEEAFPEDDLHFSADPTCPIVKPIITFKFHSFAPAVGRLRFLKNAKFSKNERSESQIIIGKRTLFSSVLLKFGKKIHPHKKCTGHSLLNYQL